MSMDEINEILDVMTPITKRTIWELYTGNRASECSHIGVSAVNWHGLLNSDDTLNHRGEMVARILGNRIHTF